MRQAQIVRNVHQSGSNESTATDRRWLCRVLDNRPCSVSIGRRSCLGNQAPRAWKASEVVA